MHWCPPTDDSYSIVRQPVFIQWIFKCWLSAVFLDVSSAKRLWKNLRSAFKRARIGLHIDTNDHAHYQIFGGRHCKTRRLFTSFCFTVCLTALCVNALNSSYRRLLLYCKAVGFYTVSIQVPIFGSILPISLQQVASEKIYTVHSNELAEGYTLMSVSIFIDKYGAVTL